MRGLFAVRLVGVVTMGIVAMAVLHVELLGAIRPFEFMALAGNGKQGNGH